MSTAVFAEGAIAGQVKDASGAILLGVTVEASSSALIEKVRSVATDVQGRFNIVDLRGPLTHGLNTGRPMTSRPTSKMSFSGPASTKILGLSRRGDGIGVPVPRSVTRMETSDAADAW
jgi:hypothetical protein